MCGIFGYVGRKNTAGSIVFSGLKRLDYRGYDSWGVAVWDGKEISSQKDVGIIDGKLKLKLPNSNMGIAHTRWATTGAVTLANAHPHYSADERFVLAQNGIVDNYVDLKKYLKKRGHKFVSQTDTEVIVRLVEEELRTEPDLERAVRSAFKQLAGRNTIILLDSQTECVMAVRNGSPLVMGKTDDGDVYLSSDSLSLSGIVRDLVVVDNGQLVLVNHKVKVVDIVSGDEVTVKSQPLKFNSGSASKGKYAHFMLKEIYDTPAAIEAVTNTPMAELERLADAIYGADKVFTVGSGTAGISASQIAYYLRNEAGKLVTSLVGADAMDYYRFFDEQSLLIAPSQSGETADVLEVLEQAKRSGAKIASFVNMPGAMMTRMADFAFMANAGPEKSVLSTKVFTAQMAWGYLVSQTLNGNYTAGARELIKMAKKMEEYLNDKNVQKGISNLAGKLASVDHIFLLGKGGHFNLAREGMVKIIEAAYIYAHAIPAGDLKHYAITLMEKGVPVIFSLGQDEAFVDTLTAAGEVRARGAWTIAFTPVKNEVFDIQLLVPDLGRLQTIFNILPLQLLAYHMAKKLGRPIDKPRNIAKSVTVK